MPRRKGAKKAAPAVESPIVDEIADAYAEEDADVEGFGSGDPNAVAEAAAAAAVAAEAAAAAAAGNDPDEAILEAAARSAVAEAASDGTFLCDVWGTKFSRNLGNFCLWHDMCLFVCMACACF